MKKIKISTEVKKMLADIYTPVGIYLRLRDRFRDTILLESTDFHAGENSFSFIGVHAIAGIEVQSPECIEFKYPGQLPEKLAVKNPLEVPQLLWNYMQQYEIADSSVKEAKYAQGLFGYTNYDAVQYFDTIRLSNKNPVEGVGGLRYRFYQYVIVINHFKDELFICENKMEGVESEAALLESIIKSKDVPAFPFLTKDKETSNLTDEEYREMVRKGIASCYRGDVFQIVLSRRFQQQFTGDEFNVYRALRSINPSPYLFYFDYGDYKLMGSSPESQIIVKNGKAIVHPIAGTFRRTGNDELDKELASKLEKDEKENAEHVMLVDLARNDLSRMCTDVKVTQYKKINYYSHVIHLVSEVTGQVKENANPFQMLAVSFPAGTLSGAPKFKAMQLIDEYENTARNYYGGTIGFIGFDASCNHAIMIRTFMSKNNVLICQAGAGIVAKSNPESELQEVNNKLNALKNAIELAQHI